MVSIQHTALFDCQD